MAASLDIPDAATLLRRPETDGADMALPPSPTLPQELDAWRDARARAREELPAEAPLVPPRAWPAPVDDTTRPSPLSGNARLAGASGETLTDDAAEATPATRNDADDAPFGPTGAPIESLVGSPVDFVLSDMGRWPGGMDDGGANGPSPEPRVDAATDSAPSFVAAAQRRAFWRSRPMRTALGISALVLVLALLMQVALSRRSWLAAHVPALAPVLTTLCQPLGCTVPAYRDLDAIVIDSSAFNRSGPSSFRFTVTLRNQSDVPVATPSLELTLTDALEQPVVRRVVDASELKAPATLAARGEFAGANALVLTGVDNASAIAGYRLMAFYP